MKFISAEYLFTSVGPVIKNGVLVLKNDYTVETVLDPLEDDLPESSQIRRLDGLLTPGFVNSHCHLELSHLKGKFPEKTGLPGFLKNVSGQRAAEAEEIGDAIALADREMFEYGIVAVGDISNTSDTILCKQKSQIRYHTFIEIFDLTSERADVVFERGKKLKEEFLAAGLSCSLSPHAPYTTSPDLLQKIFSEEMFFTIHHDETLSEKELVEKGSGDIFQFLFSINPSFATWAGKQKNLEDYLFQSFPEGKRLQMVHNTFTNELYHDRGRDLFYCLCVRANQFIENRLPDLTLFAKVPDAITLGTDSLASNHSLNIADEITLIRKALPDFPLEVLLKAASLNGARFLGIDDEYGSFEKGKKPGIVHLTVTNEKLLPAIIHNTF